MTTFTEVIEPDGGRYEIKRDDRWNPEWAFNPNLTNFPLEEPLKIEAGSVIRTHCEWLNTTDTPVDFPAEMCVFFGFILNVSDISCTGGAWGEGLVDYDGEAVPTGPAPLDSCLGERDRAILESEGFDADITRCATGCAFDPDVDVCVAACLVDQLQVSPDCAKCNGESVACGLEHCFNECLVDSGSATCRTCTDEHCVPAYQDCRGF